MMILRNDKIIDWGNREGGGGLITLATCIKLEDNQGRTNKLHNIFLLMVMATFLVFFKRAFTNQNTHAGVWTEEIKALI